MKRILLAQDDAVALFVMERIIQARHPTLDILSDTQGPYALEKVHNGGFDVAIIDADLGTTHDLTL